MRNELNIAVKRFKETNKNFQNFENNRAMKITFKSENIPYLEDIIKKNFPNCYSNKRDNGKTINDQDILRYSGKERLLDFDERWKFVDVTCYTPEIYRIVSDYKNNIKN